MSIKHLYDDERPSLLLDFANSKTLDPRITFERLSIGTYVDELGVIKTAADNEARFDHDLATGESLGLLIEESRTNHITNSTDFSSANGDWGATSQGTSPGFPTVTPASGIAPDGTNTASRLQASTGGGTGAGDQAYIQSLRDSSTRAACSVYMKSNTGSNQTIFGTFDTQPVVVTPQWQRFTGDSDDYRIGVRGSLSDADIDILIWGAQVEDGNKGSSFCTSYIPTSGSTVQRLADEASITGTNFSSWYNQSGGTFQGSFYINNPTNTVSSAPSANYAFSVIDQSSNTTSLHVAAQLQSGSANVGAYMRNNNVAQLQPDSAVNGIVNNQVYNFAVSYELNSGGFATQGNSINVSTVPSTLPAFDEMYLGMIPNAYNSNAKMVNGRISRLAYYNTRLSDTALEALTL